MTDGARVLVIDDDPFMRQLIDVHLTRAGMSVELAAGGEEGIAKARTLTPDAIVLDYAMPVMSGQEVLQRLRRDPFTAAIPLIVISAWSSLEQRDKARSLGVAWLEKPVEGAVLVDAVQRLIRSRGVDAQPAAQP